MPFDPKLVPAAEAPLHPDGELILPDELSALADQLHDDANHLAATYPGSGVDRDQLIHLQTASPQSTPDPFHLPSRTALRSIAAACAILLAPALLYWFTTDPKPVTQNIADASSAEHNSPSSPPTTISLTDLSSPELEALLNLVQRQPNSISVSF